MDIEKTRKSVTDQKINWQIHALARMLERGISREEVKEAILYDETNHATYIITAYQPDLNHFETDLKTRQRQ